MTPFPPREGGFFIVGVSSVTPSLGVIGFVLGVETVGYRPTGSSLESKPPLGGTNPGTEKTQNKAGINKSITMKPT